MNTAIRAPLPSDKEFLLYQKLVQQKLGIFLPVQKKNLLSNRLWKRLQACDLRTFKQYYDFILSPAGRDELVHALELITTNETYFFREPKHFEYLAQRIIPRLSFGDEFRVWSAAASTGEEPYSIAMVLQDLCPCPWELLCSDVNTRVLEHARQGIYSEQRTQHIPDEYRRRFCRKGTGPHEGRLRVLPELRSAVQFFNLNLHEEFADIGQFDLIFLRNVLIYFDNANKTRVLERIVRRMKPHGLLFVGHSESLNGLTPRLTPVQPAIYRRTT